MGARGPRRSRESFSWRRVVLRSVTLGLFLGAYVVFGAHAGVIQGVVGGVVGGSVFGPLLELLTEAQRVRAAQQIGALTAELSPADGAVAARAARTGRRPVDSAVLDSAVRIAQWRVALVDASRNTRMAGSVAIVVMAALTFAELPVLVAVVVTVLLAAVGVRILLEPGANRRRLAKLTGAAAEDT